jgi:hypothetical protein
MLSANHAALDSCSLCFLFLSEQCLDRVLLWAHGSAQKKADSMASDKFY